MSISSKDRYFLSSNSKVPSAENVRKMTGFMAVYLSIQYVPLPLPSKLLDKLTTSLNLPGKIS